MFVALAEEGLRDGPITELTGAPLSGALAGGAQHAQARDGMGMGCTHFHVLKKPSPNVAGEVVALIDRRRETTAAAVEKNYAGKFTDARRPARQSAPLPGHRRARPLCSSGENCPGRAIDPGQRDAGGYYNSVSSPAERSNAAEGKGTQAQKTYRYSGYLWFPFPRTRYRSCSPGDDS